LQPRACFIAGHPLAAIKLRQPEPNFRIDRLAAFEKPAVLFFLRLQEPFQGFFDAPASPDLLLHASFKGRIIYIDVHRSCLLF
jgi:hypothetical protein